LAPVLSLPKYLSRVELTTWFLLSEEVRESQGKIRRSGKVREFHISKSGKNKRFRENQSTMVQKLTKMQKKF